MVVGTDELKRKFSKIMFNKEIEFGSFGISQCDKMQDEEPAKKIDEKVDICFLLTLNNDDTNISQFIKNGTIKTIDKTCYKFGIIIAVVDVDQDLEKIKTDIKNVVNFICSYKRDCDRVMVVGCSDRNDLTAGDSFMANISNYVGRLEREILKIKNDIFNWQFLYFDFIANCTNKSEFLKFIVDCYDTYVNLANL